MLTKTNMPQPGAPEPAQRKRPFERLRGRLSVNSVRSIYGVKLAPNWRDTTFQLYLIGAYGRTLARMLSRRDSPFVFVDVGANQGLYSLLAAKNPNCRGVIALEPVAETFALLSRNIALNGLTERITALPWAISDRSGTAPIGRIPRHSGGASLEADARGLETHEIITLRDFNALAPLLPGPKLPLFIKIDVEGHEPAVIRSLAAAESIHPRVTDLFYEVDERWVSVTALQQQLEALGFGRFRNVGRRRHRDIHARR